MNRTFQSAKRLFEIMIIYHVVFKFFTLVLRVGLAKGLIFMTFALCPKILSSVFEDTKHWFIMIFDFPVMVECLVLTCDSNIQT